MAETPLPSALKRQLDRSEQLVKERTAPPAKAAESEPTPAPTPAAPEPSAPAPSAPLAPAGPKPVDWEQRHKVLEGMLAATQREKQQEKADMDARFEAQNRKLAELQQELNQSRQAPQALSPMASMPGSAALREEGHDEMIVKVTEGLERTIAEQSQQMAQQGEVIRQLQAQLASTDSVVTQSREDVFWQHFMEAVPDWQDVNRDPAFIAFMQEPVPDLSRFAGDTRTRQELLDDAQRALDGPRVVAFYDDFKQAHQRQSSPASAAPETPLDISPSVGAGEGPQSGQTYTYQEFKSTMDAISKGRIRGKNADDLEAELTKAAQEGRVTGIPSSQGPKQWDPNSWNV